MTADKSSGILGLLGGTASIRFPADVTPADLGPVFAQDASATVTTPVPAQVNFHRSPAAGPYRVTVTDTRTAPTGRSVTARLAVTGDQRRVRVSHNGGVTMLALCTLAFLAAFVCLVIAVPQLGLGGAGTGVKALAMVGVALVVIGILATIVVKSVRRNFAAVIARVVFDAARTHSSTSTVPMSSTSSASAGLTPTAPDSLRIIGTTWFGYLGYGLMGLFCWVWGIYLILDHDHSGYAWVVVAIVISIYLASRNRSVLTIDVATLRYGRREMARAQLARAALTIRGNSSGRSLGLMLYDHDDRLLTRWPLPIFGLYGRFRHRAEPIQDFLEAHQIPCEYQA